jgi:hypothetical protein
MMASNEEIELLLSKSVRDYILHFNMLERNVAYSLRYAKKQGSRSISIESLLALPFCTKISKLKEIISEQSLNANFCEWLEAIDHCRTMRNRLVHGHWEVVWHLDKPIRFAACQIKSSDKSRVEGSYTIESLSEELIKLKKVAEDFRKLRSKYENSRLSPNMELQQTQKDVSADFNC